MLEERYHLSPADPRTGLTVFCGSSSGNDPVYLAAADSLAVAIAHSGKTLVYGGGTKGLMGRVASSTLNAGGKVHGIIPSAFLSNEAPDRSSRLHPTREVETVCGSMHERKRLFADRSTGFIGLPGGYGTLEEVMEMTTWSQIGVHKKPVVLLNVNGFYSPLRQFIEGAIASGFIAPSNRNFLIFIDEPRAPQPRTTDTDTDAAGAAVAAAAAFDWGRAALAAVDAWLELGTGGAEPFELEWRTDGGDDEGGPRDKTDVV
ncbi:hypothetical protein JCM11491_000428 [Sporobolomyces phaffii]